MSGRSLHRRQVLAGLGAASALPWLRTAGALGPTPRGHLADHGDLGELAERFRSTTRDGAFDAAARAIRDGADQRTMLGAIFLAGLVDIRPRPHGILHAVMMVESSFQLAAASPRDEGWLFVLFNLHDLGRSLERDVDESDDWTLPPAPTVRRRSARAARAELVAALDAWDAERADAAVLGLLPHADHATLFELLWPVAARCFAFIGHKAIYAAQLERVLARIGWRHASPALRSLVRTVLVDRDTAAFEQSRELSGRMPEGWMAGAEEPAASATVLVELRSASPREAPGVVVEAIRSGLGPRTVWDALRLLGSELFHRRPGRTSDTGRLALLPVHGLTVTNALGHAWRTTESDGTRRLLLLQAASWLAAMRDALGSMVQLSMEGPGIEELGNGFEEPTSELDAVLERAAPGGARVHLDRNGTDVGRYLARLRTALSRTGREHHQHKYAAAMQEEASLADARWPSRILAPAVDYLANPRDPATEVHARSLRVLRASAR